MELEQLSLAKDVIEKELSALKELYQKDAKNRKSLVLQDMQKVYGHMRHGKAVIDLYVSMKSAGLNREGDPKLAIVRADSKNCYCVKEQKGKAVFKSVEIWKCPKDQMIEVPEDTFIWPLVSRTWSAQTFQEIKNPRLKTVVPLIPPSILIAEVKHQLHNYHILWEVESWQKIPKDPILLKQLSPSLYGVLATWDLTEVERAILKGRL
jgi:hypothetical protein